ncbi:flagellar motor stator protein MotA [Clostridium cylindrosporum]|uniref:Motility protein A n=1 Tax=Clostridium cylindrosporum DSM 605 TaxID=1121307 RepID=A0A0J8DCF1_CLOCY|nr:flagellar motor stator protein MotA [Clostridium cylindrosporum]KMT21933.1 motility protein A [Clostridium cylindrosporum DSM 605]
MDIFLIIGLITGLLSVIVGMIVKGADVAVLLNPAAAIIICVGTVAAVMNSFPKEEFLNTGKLLGVLFSDKKGDDPVSLIERLVNMSKETRKNGLLALESMIEGVDNKFMKTALEMIVDGSDPQYVREVLSDEISCMEDRHRAGAQLFTCAGSSAPTLGVLGAVIGLIGALGNLNDTEKLAHMIAAAFVATLYGIFIGYVVCHPFASRLKRKSQVEANKMQIILEGAIAIQQGVNPNAIEKKLATMLKPKDRARLEQNSSNE